ncbi:coiled-coil domain-containing protein 42 like-2-like [Cololabis saira]|uniref:coiled-coil domain-containing protein 42 like-2-like n=1 Tax=Cololabis saira TaxID=129043 RepID=UPI002AD322E5|nr:coiled-coil domain-containing protein 42 like-2-like [Cololabis saira]
MIDKPLHHSKVAVQGGNHKFHNHQDAADFLQGISRGLWPVGMTDENFFTRQLELSQKEKQLEEADITYEERKQELESLQRNFEELMKKMEKKRRLRHQQSVQKEDEELQVAEREADRKLQESTVAMETVRAELEQLRGRSQQLQQQVKGCSRFNDFLEQTLPMTQFQDVDELTGRLEKMLHIRDELYQKESGAQEQLIQARRKLRKMEEDHELFCLQMNHQVFHLQGELEEASKETQIWERQWNHIQDTAARKMLEAGQIKLATLNLYDQVGGVVDINGPYFHKTEEQLEQIKISIQKKNAFLKEYKSSLQTPMVKKVP